MSGSLRSEVRSFLRRTGMPKTKLGRLTMNDPVFVDRLYREEYTPRAETVRKLRAFMSEYVS